MVEDNEIWLDVKEYEGLYQVSNLGRVRSLDRIASYLRLGVPMSMVKKGIILKHNLINGGYLQVALSDKMTGRYAKSKLVHRLVCEAFIDNTLNKTQVNHKDGIKTNNVLNNLEWVTPSENIIHAHAAGLYYNRVKGTTHGMSKLTDAAVIKIRTSYIQGVVSMESLAKKFNVNRITIGRVLRRESWGHVE